MMGMERTARVTGKGKLYFKPDMIRLRIELTNQDKEYEDTIRKSTDHSEAVKKSLRGIGF